MATLYNTVSRNGNSKTEKIYLTLSNILYIHDTGGYDISEEANISDYTSLPWKNKYSYKFDYEMHYHFLELDDNITSASNYEVYPAPEQMTNKLQRMRRTLPYVKNLSEYTNSLFYFNQKYYTPYVIHIGLIPQHPTQATALSEWNPNIYSYKTGSAYTYLPNIMLYTDMYSGLWNSGTDLTHYSPSFNLMGHRKRPVESSYAYYLGSYFYRYVWKGIYNDDYTTDHLLNPTQYTGIIAGSSSGTITCRGLCHTDIGFLNGSNWMSHDVNIASSISYIDLVVEFPEEWLDRVLDKIGPAQSPIPFRSWVYAQYHDDNYDYSYTYSYSYSIPEDQGNKCYFRFVRNSNATSDYSEYAGPKYWVANEWGIYRNSDSSVQTYPDLGDSQINWGADDSHISILRYFAVFLGTACSYFNPYSLHNSIDSDLYHNINELAIITNNSSYTGLKAFIKALHIHVVNNTSYINNQNSCSIVENQFQYWYARIGGAFKRNMINIYVNNGLINQGTEWGWSTEGAAFTALTPIKIYNGPIIDNGGNYSDLPCGWYSENEHFNKYIYDNNGSAPSLHDCTQLEYLQSTGTQYIDTAVLPEKYIHIYIECTPSSTTDHYVCGVRNNKATGTRWAIGNTSNFYAALGSTMKTTTISVNTDNKYFVEIYYNGTNVMFKCGVVGGSNSALVTLGTDLGFSPASVIRIFGSSGYVADYTKWSGKIYCCKIWGGYPNEYPIIDMIPVSYNNSYGMYDRISKRIFYNMGSGSFTAGPQVYKSNNTLRIWIDDFYDKTEIAGDNGYNNWTSYISTVIYDITNNEDTWGANPYEYTGETFEWNGSNFYIWKFNGDLVGHSPGDVKYLLTDTIDYDELYERSLDYDPDNYGGIICFLSNDLEEYRIVEYSGFSPDETSDSIITVEKLRNYL